MMNVQFDKSQTGLNQIKMYDNQSLLTNSNGAVTGAEITNNLGNAAMSIGGTAVSGYPFLNADIAEIIVYNKILTSYERITIYNYLNNKYFSNKVSTQFSSIPVNSIHSNSICDDNTWRHSFNTTQLNQVITSVKSACLTFDERKDSVFVEANAIPYAGSYFMRRHFVIEPLVEYNGTKTVRLYYSLADFNDLKNYVPSLSSHSQLAVTQYDGLNEDGIYSPTGGTLSLIPSSQITNGTANGMYYLQFNVNHFSEFWIHVGDIVLPVSDLHLSVISNKQTHQLSWQCMGCDEVLDFNVLESPDAVNYKKVQTIHAIPNNSLYTTAIAATTSPVQYFAIETNDIDGHHYRSNICVASNKSTIYQLEANTTNQIIKLTSNRQGAKIIVYNINGQVMARGENELSIDKHSLLPGLYIALLLESGVVQQNLKFAVY